MKMQIYQFDKKDKIIWLLEITKKAKIVKKKIVKIAIFMNSKNRWNFKLINLTKQKIKKVQKKIRKVTEWAKNI